MSGLLNEPGVLWVEIDGKRVWSLPTLVQIAKLHADQLTDDQRVELMGNYCRSCGCKDPSCQCWNDE